MVLYNILVGECSTFWVSRSEPTGAGWAPQRVQVAWFQLLVSAIETPVLPPANFQLFEAHCLDKRVPLSAASEAGGQLDPVLSCFES